MRKLLFKRIGIAFVVALALALIPGANAWASEQTTDNTTVLEEEEISSEGVYVTYDTDTELDELVVPTATEVTIKGATMTINGDLNITGGKINFAVGQNGLPGKLIVTGDLNIPGGTLAIFQGASVTVNGNLNIQGINGEQGTGALYLEGAECLLAVKGNMSVYTGGDVELRSGTIRLSNNLFVTKSENGDASFDMGYAKTHFVGAKQHTVTFPVAGEGFSRLEVDEGGSILATDYFRAVALESDLFLTAPKQIKLSGEIDCMGHTLTLDKDLVILSGSLEVNSQSMCNASGNIWIQGGYMTVFGGSVTVEKNFNISTQDGRQSTGGLYIEGDESVLSVKGNMNLFTGGEVALRSGTLKLYNDLLVTKPSSGNATFGSSFLKTTFEGAKQHTVTLPVTGEGFGRLEVEEGGSILATDYFRAGELVSDLFLTAPKKINQCGDIDCNNHTLTLDKDLLILDGTLKVNAQSTCRANGNVILQGGTMTVFGGEAAFSKDFTIATQNERQGTGSFYMEGENSVLTVNGNLTILTGGEVALRTGNLNVGKNITVKQPTSKKALFSTSGVKTTLLNASTVTFENKGCKFGELILEQEYQDYTFNVKNCWDNLILKKVNMEKCKVELEDDEVAFTGKAVMPLIKSVTLDKDDISVSKDAYIVSAENNIVPGTATLILKGAEPGYNTCKVSYKINYEAPKFGKVKKAGKKKLKASWTKSEVADGYEVIYGLKKNFKGAKKKVIKKAKTTTAVLKKLKNKKNYYVRVRAFKTVNGKKVYSTWSKTKKAKTA